MLSPLFTQEATLSSQIEGTQATVREVLEFEADPHEKMEPAKRSDIQEIINYRTALNRAVEDLDKRPLCLNLIRDLHAILMDSVRGRNSAPGEFRRIQNFIAPSGRPIEEATFVPPSAEMILPSLDNWEKYIHHQEKDPLVQLALVKAQFELIHPFLDGNGRVAGCWCRCFYTARDCSLRRPFISAPTLKKTGMNITNTSEAYPGKTIGKRGSSSS